MWVFLGCLGSLSTPRASLAVGSFDSESRTLYVGGVPKARNVKALLTKHFEEWGELEVRAPPPHTPPRQRPWVMCRSGFSRHPCFACVGARRQNINYIPRIGAAFVRYRMRASAEFARVRLPPRRLPPVHPIVMGASCLDHASCLTAPPARHCPCIRHTTLCCGRRWRWRTRTWARRRS